ncbi:NUDIX domain-containing protein [Microbacterium sp. SSW1-59]|uniref:NUDIX domain-containing protein n=1 Tax=Microbacterium xanthum TaxID=3079794 RepID=UPI002AD4F434|nr:NUDIX domain-containing protein [Microbacterium sp. SSW1-59]MDZ8200991.1 NUDIX domain-containing protein [Microbacterium sp. SSW1-59]
MTVHSAGILLYRLRRPPVDDAGAAPGVEVMIAHMGGPFWASKDTAAWSIPKGEYDPDAESAAAAAVREFREELGVDPPAGPAAELGTFPSSSGKRVTVFVADGAGFTPPEDGFGVFEMEWPPRSGRTATFPEVDRAAWFALEDAREKLVKGQRPVLDALLERLREALD